MSRQINQPINQVRLTNVAVVRYNCHGKRFEIACYRNKILDYRSGLETDLSEVLQTDRVFVNVSKGQFANLKDLKKVFHTDNEEDIARIILEKGQIQVSQLEREQLYDNTLAQIATWVANNCVSSNNERPFTVHQIQQALQAYPLQPHKPMKKQCLDAVRYLQTNTTLQVQRAKMEVSLEFAQSSQEIVQKALSEIIEGQHQDQQQDTSSSGTQRVKIVKEETKVKTNSGSSSNDDATVVVMMTLRVDPSLYRHLDELAKQIHGRLEILQQVVQQQQHDGDADFNTASTAQVQQPQIATHVVFSLKQDQPQGKHENDTDSDDEDDPFIAQQLEAMQLKNEMSNKNKDEGGKAIGGTGGDDDDSDDSKEDHQGEHQSPERGKEHEQDKEHDGDENDDDHDHDDEPHKNDLTRKELRKQKKAKRKQRKLKQENQQQQQGDREEAILQSLLGAGKIAADSDNDDDDDDDDGAQADNHPDGEDDDDDKDDDPLFQPHLTRKAQRKQQKKANRKNKSTLRHQRDNSDDDSANGDDNDNGKHHQVEKATKQTASPTSVDDPATATKGTKEDREKSDATAAAGKSCNTCGGNFLTAAAYRAHFKTDWHRFNLKLKLKGIPIVSEQEFLLCDQSLFEVEKGDFLG